MNFDDLNAPIGDTIAGRTPFDGNHYASRGFSFASPDGYDLYVAPGGLFWNASNSLSVGRFPFDPMDPGSSDPADSLTVTLNPGCRGVSFEIVDNTTRNPSERVEFNTAGTLLKATELPADFTNGRAFVGLVSTTSVTKVLIVEDAKDGDDVNFDDFTCFRQ